MKPFELAYLCAEPFLSPLLGKVRNRLRRVARNASGVPEILDVGGRKSHYTIGVPARITITDLPRTSDVQTKLNLGVTDQIVNQTLRRRTNVARILLDDMTQSQLPSDSFDCVVAVEVLEHVAEDALFVSQVRRVLKPNGTFIMTTPNGDFVPNNNPDHKRHYTRAQLANLLAEYFTDVEVNYTVRTGKWHAWGLQSWSLSRPDITLLSMAGNLVTAMRSASPSSQQSPLGNCHLFATARSAK